MEINLKTKNTTLPRKPQNPIKNRRGKMVLKIKNLLHEFLQIPVNN